MLAILSAIKAEVWKWGAIVLGILGVLAYARKTGRDSERAEVAIAKAQAKEKADVVENKILGMSDDAITKRLRDKWQRD